MTAGGTRGDVGTAERLVCSDPARALRSLLAGPASRSFRTQRHDSVLILACWLRQSDCLACAEHLPHVRISAARLDTPLSKV